jgi:serine/threonine protein kinase
MEGRLHVRNETSVGLRQAPELLMGARCSEKLDIWSLAVVLWEIATGDRPIRGQLRDLQ